MASVLFRSQLFCRHTGSQLVTGESDYPFPLYLLRRPRQPVRHPVPSEKATAGLQLLANFVNWDGGHDPGLVFVNQPHSILIMLLIPAIDLKDGQCVRLRRGEMEGATVFSDNPAAMAKHWLDSGAGDCTLVDLNGAFAGKPKTLAPSSKFSLKSMAAFQCNWVGYPLA